jgi:hypothetical protein
VGFDSLQNNVPVKVCSALYMVAEFFKSNTEPVDLEVGNYGQVVRELIEGGEHVGGHGIVDSAVEGTVEVQAVVPYGVQAAR